MSKRGRMTLGMGALLSLPACAVVPEDGWEAEIEREVVDRAAVFRQRGTLGAGLVPVQPGVSVEAGDEVLFGLCLDVRNARTIWYLRLCVLDVQPKPWLFLRGVQDFESRVEPRASNRTPAPDPIEGLEGLEGLEGREGLDGPGILDLSSLSSTMPIARIRVEAFDEQGNLLSTGESVASVERLRTGLFAACRAGHAQRDVMRGRVALGREAPMLRLDERAMADVNTVAEGVAACDVFFALLQKNPVTRQILFQVIALPTLWSIARNLGVRTGFSIDFFAATPVDPGRFPQARRPLWSAPLTVELNGQPALLARVVAGQSGAPDGVAAGVFGLVGRHPTDRRRRVRVQLLASGRRWCGRR